MATGEAYETEPRRRKRAISNFNTKTIWASSSALVTFSYLTRCVASLYSVVSPWLHSAARTWVVVERAAKPRYWRESGHEKDGIGEHNGCLAEAGTDGGGFEEGVVETGAKEQSSARGVVMCPDGCRLREATSLRYGVLGHNRALFCIVGGNRGVQPLAQEFQVRYEPPL
ncbi:hypothetical protein KM043_007035 [Ampulex compressa]|nr:hypothetical protein KM043_007035 [Ampulex compressa]